MVSQQLLWVSSGFEKGRGTDSGPATERKKIIKHLNSIIESERCQLALLLLISKLVSQLQLCSTFQFCALGVNPTLLQTLLPPNSPFSYLFPVFPSCLDRNVPHC